MAFKKETALQCAGEANATNWRLSMSRSKEGWSCALGLRNKNMRGPKSTWHSEGVKQVRFQAGRFLRQSGLPPYLILQGPRRSLSQEGSCRRDLFLYFHVWGSPQGQFNCVHRGPHLRDIFSTKSQKLKTSEPLSFPKPITHPTQSHAASVVPK